MKNVSGVGALESAAVSPVRGVHMTHLVSNIATNVYLLFPTFVTVFETKCVMCTPRTGDTAALIAVYPNQILLLLECTYFRVFKLD